MMRARLPPRHVQFVQPPANGVLVHLRRDPPLHFGLQVHASTTHRIVDRRIGPREHQLESLGPPQLADHRDPFDCLLIAQTQAEGMLLVSKEACAKRSPSSASGSGSHGVVRLVLSSLADYQQGLLASPSASLKPSFLRGATMISIKLSSGGFGLISPGADELPLLEWTTHRASNAAPTFGLTTTLPDILAQNPARPKGASVFKMRHARPARRIVCSGAFGLRCVPAAKTSDQR
jgi:hypothetical protein